MKKKSSILLKSLIFGGLALGMVPTSIVLAKAISDSTKKTFSSDIIPTSPSNGATIPFVPENVQNFYALEDLVNTYNDQKGAIGELTPYSAEMNSFVNYMGNTESDKQARRYLFNKYDAFKPTNNTLGWESKINAKEYKVIVSQSKDFANIEREYVVTGDKNSVIFENPYSGVNYYWQVIATKQDDSLAYSDIFNFSSAVLPRTINLEGVSNTRDLGGNVGLNSKRTKEGLVYRGAGLEAITSLGESEFKNQLGIKTEIDLRGIGEGIENYLGLSNYYHYSSPYAYATTNPDSSCINYFGTGSLVPNFGNAVKVLANKDNYPLYFHCSVGRDRTGFLGLVINFLCGVSEEITLKDFIMSLFSTTGGYVKGNIDFYNRFIGIRDYFNTYTGNNLSEKVENYLITRAGVTHEECENIRKIFLGDISAGFVPGKVNPDSYKDLVKVTFRRYGYSPVIKMVDKGSKIDNPGISSYGNWYHGSDLWDFDNDVVNEDIYLDYISYDKCKVSIHYSGLDVADEVIDVAYHNEVDFTRFNRSGYTFKVYDDSFNLLSSCLVEGDTTLNVIYKSINGYIPKANTRIIVTAGQSNAAGVGHYPYLETSLDEAKIAEINNGYDNVQILGYSHEQHITEFRKVYADAHLMSAGTPGTFGYEISMAERFSKLFPDETTYFVKYAFGGCSLNYDFISPSCDVEQLMGSAVPGRPRGWMYTGLVDYLKLAISTIEASTNTIPMIEGFMWMQGESDATTEQLANLYLTTFNTLVSDFTTEFKDNISYKFAVYDAGIAEGTIWPYAESVNMMKRSRCDSRNVFIDTNIERMTTLFEPVGEVDNAHYDAACYIDLGHMFADAYMSHNYKDYTHNEVTLEGPESITLKIGDAPTIVLTKAWFNGEECDAKFSFFSKNTSNFIVNVDNTLTALYPGDTELRITAYYQDEVNTIIVPVTIIE